MYGSESPDGLAHVGAALTIDDSVTHPFGNEGAIETPRLLVRPMRVELGYDLRSEHWNRGLATVLGNRVSGVFQQISGGLGS
jgi:hypothetical protein